MSISSTLDGSFYIVSIWETALFFLWSFFLLRLCFTFYHMTLSEQLLSSFGWSFKAALRCRTSCSALIAALDPWSNCRVVSSQSLFHRYHIERYSYGLAKYVALPHSLDRSSLYSGRLHDSFCHICRSWMSMQTVSFLV